MEKEAVGIAETIVLAKEEACRILNMNSDELEFEVIQMPTKKTLGIFGGKPAKVRAFVKRNPAKIATNYIKAIINHMQLENVDIEVDAKESEATINLVGDDIGYLIGRRGETLDAIQYLSGLVANNSSDSYYRISVDTANYREKREKTLENLATRMANKASRTKRIISLEPMNPYERRVIHTVIQEIKGVSSWSEGKDKDRHVVIAPEGRGRSNYRRSAISGKQVNSSIVE